MLLSFDLQRSREGNSGKKTGDEIVINGVGSGDGNVLSGRNLVGQLNLLVELEVAGLNGAGPVDLFGLLAQVQSLADEPDVAVSHLDLDVGALLNVLVEVSGRLDGEVLALGRGLGSMDRCLISSSCSYSASHSEMGESPGMSSSSRVFAMSLSPPWATDMPKSLAWFMSFMEFASGAGEATTAVARAIKGRMDSFMVWSVM